MCLDCTSHCGSNVSNPYGVVSQLILWLCLRQQASVQAAEVVSTLNFNSAIYHYGTLYLMLYYDARCLTHYHHYHNLVHLFSRCQHWVSKLKLPVSNTQCPNRSGQYSICGRLFMIGQGGNLHKLTARWEWHIYASRHFHVPYLQLPNGNYIGAEWFHLLCWLAYTNVVQLAIFHIYIHYIDTPAYNAYIHALSTSII